VGAGERSEVLGGGALDGGELLALDGAGASARGVEEVEAHEASGEGREGLGLFAESFCENGPVSGGRGLVCVRWSGERLGEGETARVEADPPAEERIEEGASLFAELDDDAVSKRGDGCG
jgi:hypothetical protein